MGKAAAAPTTTTEHLRICAADLPDGECLVLSANTLHIDARWWDRVSPAGRRHALAPMIAEASIDWGGGVYFSGWGARTKVEALRRKLAAIPAERIVWLVNHASREIGGLTLFLFLLCLGGVRMLIASGLCGLAR